MNRAVSSRPPADLPPMGRQGRTRMLLLTLDGMGWSTYASSMAAVTAGRDDIDAVHLRYRGSGVKRLLSVPVPGGRGHLDAHVRRVLVARQVIRRWVAGPLDLRRFDVVHVTPQQYGLGFVGAARRTGTPLSSLIDATVYQAKGELMGASAAAVERQYGPLIDAERTVLGAAGLVVATSRWAADDAVARFGVDPDRLMVAPLALPPPAPDAPRAHPDHRTPRIVFVGADWQRKGGDRLLRWHQQRWAATAELHLCTPEVPPAGCRNVVHHGLVPHDELLTHLLPTMDVFVLPTGKDMSPWAVLEASSVGLPVVSSAIGGITELIADGVTGFLRAPADDAGFVAAIERLLDDPDLRVRMGTAGRAATMGGSDRTGNDDVLDRLVQLAGP